MLKHRAASEAGSSLVELALVVPMLALVLIGAAELGRIAYAAIEVSNAARAAVAFGAQGPTTALQTGIMQQAALNEAPNVTGLVATATESCVCETITSATGAISRTTITAGCTNALSQCTTITPGQIDNVVDYVNVTTTATVHTMFRYNWNGYGIPNTFKLNGYAQMRFFQN